METIPLRIAYTQYKRHQSAKQELPIACNALVANNGETTIAHSYLSGLSTEKNNPVNLLTSDSDPSLPPYYPTAETEKTSDEKFPSFTTSTKDLSDSSSSISASSSTSDLSTIPTLHRARPLAQPFAILPQYLTTAPTTLTITEASFPHLGSNFTVTTPAAPDQPILRIHRERPSLTHKQVITDASTSTDILQIRRQRGSIPMSHYISDPADTKVAEIQGNFSAPGQGARVKVWFTNVCDGKKTQLAVVGKWKNRQAEIRHVDSGEVLAAMSSAWFTARSVLGSRRDYQVSIAAGVDVVMIVTLIMALDAR